MDGPRLRWLFQAAKSGFMEGFIARSGLRFVLYAIAQIRLSGFCFNGRTILGKVITPTRFLLQHTKKE